MTAQTTETCDHPFLSPMSASTVYCGACDTVMDLETGEIIPDEDGADR